MTDRPLAPLGVLTLIRRAVDIFRANPVPFMLPVLASWLAVAGVEAAIPEQEARDMGRMIFGITTLTFLEMVLLIPITAMTLSHAAGRPVSVIEGLRRIPGAIAPAGLVALVWIAATGVLWAAFEAASPDVIGVRMVFSFAPFITAFLLWVWLAGALCVAIPAIIAEGAGFGAIRRSLALTKGFRWPAVGAVLGITVLISLAQTATGALVLVIGGVLGRMDIAAQAPVEAGLTMLLSAAVSTPIYILPALVHQRLIAIKEGGAAAELTEVFE